MERKRITIIGGGFAGVSLAMELARLNDSSLDIVIIEKSRHIALGLAYSTQDPNHLLNVPAFAMSAFEDMPNDFINWLGNSENIAHDFFPRFIYGRYLQSRFNNIREHAKSNINILHAEAIGINIKKNQAQITCANGDTIQTEKIVLALGNLPPKKIIPHADTSLIITNPWKQEMWIDLPRDKQLLILGTGQTMVDQVVSLFSNPEFKGKIIALSPHGLLPHPHCLQNKIPYPLPKEPLPGTLKGLLKFIRSEIQNFNGPWHLVIDSLSQIVPDIWQHFTLKEKSIFIRHVKPFWNIHRHRIAPVIDVILKQAIYSNRLNIIAGRFKQIDFDKEDITVTYQQRHSKQINGLIVSHLMNCTEPNRNYLEADMPLIHSLVRQGKLTSHSLNLGVKVNSEGALLDNQGMASTILFTLGPACIGQYWESIAVPAIRKQSKKLAKHLLYL